MVPGYSVLQGRRRSRISVFLFSALALLLAIGLQWRRAMAGEGFRIDDLFVYTPVLFLLLAAGLRTYLFYLLSAFFCIVHQLLYIVAASLEEGAYTSLSAFDTFSEYALLFLTIALFWQILLFYTGHADLAALTNTTLLCVIISLLLTFLPYIVNTLSGTLYMTDSYLVTCLSLGYLSFANGIVRLPGQEGERNGWV